MSEKQDQNVAKIATFLNAQGYREKFDIQKPQGGVYPVRIWNGSKKPHNYQMTVKGDQIQFEGELPELS